MNKEIIWQIKKTLWVNSILSFDFLINFDNYFSLTFSRYPETDNGFFADLYCIYTLISEMLQVPKGRTASIY